MLLSRFSHVRLCETPWTAAHQAPHPWDSPGNNTGVGCHFLLQCTKVKSQSEVVQSCPTLSDLMDCSLPGSSIHGIFQARVLEWGALPSPIYIYIHTHISPPSPPPIPPLQAIPEHRAELLVQYSSFSLALFIYLYVFY